MIKGNTATIRFARVMSFGRQNEPSQVRENVLDERGSEATGSWTSFAKYKISTNETRKASVLGEGKFCIRTPYRR